MIYDENQVLLSPLIKSQASDLKAASRTSDATQNYIIYKDNARAKCCCLDRSGHATATLLHATYVCQHCGKEVDSRAWLDRTSPADETPFETSTPLHPGSLQVNELTTTPGASRPIVSRLSNKEVIDNLPQITKTKIKSQQRKLSKSQDQIFKPIKLPSIILEQSGSSLSESKAEKEVHDELYSSTLNLKKRCKRTFNGIYYDQGRASAVTYHIEQEFGKHVQDWNATQSDKKPT